MNPNPNEQGAPQSEGLSSPEAPQPAASTQRAEAIARIGNSTEFLRAALTIISSPPTSLRETKLSLLEALRDSEPALSRFDLDLTEVPYQNEGRALPLDRQVFFCAKDLFHETGVQAAVLDHDTLNQFGHFAYIASDGSVRIVSPTDVPEDDVLVLLPADFGDTRVQSDPQDPERIACKAFLDEALVMREMGAGPMTRSDFIRVTGNREIHITRADLVCHGLHGTLDLVLKFPERPKEFCFGFEQIRADHAYRLVADDLADL
jgi:hypothetical protein